MTHEYVVLVGCYKYDQVTWKHLGLMQEHNPGIPIIPLLNQDVGLPNQAVLSKNCPWDVSNEWAACDTLLYRWFMQRPFSAARYIYTEWDTLCEISFKEFFQDAWDAPFAAPLVLTHQANPEWDWFQHVDQLPADRRHCAAGVGPGCLLFSHESLYSVAMSAAPKQLFCELRLGTTLNWLGIPMTQVAGMSDTIKAVTPDIVLQSAPTIYHPVKTLDWKQVASRKQAGP